MKETLQIIKHRKAQMEIMGLAIVIILVIVGMLFAIRFVVLKAPTEIKEDYTRAQLVSNFGIALLQASTENCKDTDITELITDCAEFQYIVCGDGRGSCEYVNATIDSILQQTMVEWRIPYHITAFTGRESAASLLLNYSNRGCVNNMPGKAEPFFLPSDRGVITFKIYICEAGQWLEE